MATKDEIVELLVKSHQEVEKLVDQVDQHLDIYPDWTIREVLAHFTGWDRAVINSLKTLVKGGIPSTAAGGDHNLYNAETVAERDKISFADIYQEWQHTHEQLKITIRELSPDVWEKEFIFPWGQTGNVEDLVIGLTREHEVAHVNEVLRSIDK